MEKSPGIGYNGAFNEGGGVGVEIIVAGSPYA